MKNSYKNLNFILFAIIFIITQSTLFSQGYYCYTPAGKIDLEVSTNKILLKFWENQDEDIAFSLLKSQAALTKIERKDLISINKQIALDLPESFTIPQVEQLLSQLENLETIQFAHPFFTPDGKTPQSFGEQLMVGLKNINDYPLLTQKIEEYDLKLERSSEYDEKQFFLKTKPESAKNALEVANELVETALFDWVEVDFLRQLRPLGTIANTPINDPLQVDQWHLTGATQVGGISDADIDGHEAFCVTSGHPNIRIAIIDDGMQHNHEDLIANALPGYDASTGIEGNVFAGSHGTGVAGLAAAAGNNSKGGAGVAFSCKLVPVLVIANGGYALDSWSSDGIDWAWKYGGADVLNNSWGGGLPATIIDNAINRAVTLGRGGMGCPVIFSAGNDFNSSSIYPGSNPQTISVGSSDPNDQLKIPTAFPAGSYGSNHGTNVDVYAPGTLMITTFPTAGLTGYTFVFNGTSSAAPLVSGIAALVLSKNPSLLESDVRYAIESTCEKVGGYTYNSSVAGQPNGTWSFQLGYGRANAHLALLAAASPVVNDVGVQQILAPSSDCGLSNTQQASVIIKNYGSATQSNITVQYRLDYNGGGFGSWLSGGSTAGLLGSFAETIHNFNINVASTGSYTMEVRTVLAGDAIPINDAHTCDFEHRPIVSSFPYSECFETGDGNWYSRANSDWKWGFPQATHENTFITNAAEGGSCWTTNLYGSYSGDSKYYLYSPCFNFSGMSTAPIISFKLIHQIQNIGDYAFLEYSTNGGSTWALVGSQGTGTNWFNNPTGWLSITQNGPNGWLDAAARLTGLQGQSQVQLRFGMTSNSLFQFDGIAVDCIKIFEPNPTNAGVIHLKSPKSNCCMTNEDVTITIQNLGNSTITSCPLQYRYSLNGSGFTAWTSAGNYSGNIPSGGATDYNFQVNFSTLGNYVLEVRTQIAGDTDSSNDVAFQEFSHYTPMNVYPFSESFEFGNGFWNVGGLNRTYDLGPPAGMNINSASDGTNAWVTGLTSRPYWNEIAWIQSPCFDFSGMTQPEVSLDIVLDSPGSSISANITYSLDGTTWNVLGSAGDPDNWYDANSTMQNNTNPGWISVGGGSWITAKYLLTALAGQNKVWFRVNFESGFNFSTPFDGFGFDKFEIKDLTGPGDAGVIAISNPNTLYCLSFTETVNVTIKNFGQGPLTSIPVEYRVNYNSGGFGAWQSAGTWTGNLTNGNTATHTFVADFSIVGTYVLAVRTNLASDGNPSNDDASKAFSNLGQILTFPYSESFETDNGKWFSGGTNSSWAHGNPSGAATIWQASDGTNIWGTNLTGNANESEDSWIQSPCFNFLGLTAPQLSFDIWYHQNFSSQAGFVEYSTNGGTLWQVLGAFGDPNNWYNIQEFCGPLQPDGWTGQSSGWLTATHSLGFLAGQGNVTFRIRFRACSTGSNEGLGVDKFLIIDAGNDDTGVISIDKPVSGCDFSVNQIVEVKIQNFGGSPITTVPIEYNYDFENTGSIGWTSAGTWTGNLASGQQTTFQFSLNLSQIGAYSFQARTRMATDANPANDEKTKDFINYGNSISVFPYAEDFESTNGGWREAGTNPSWEWGQPVNSTINSASKGAKAWVTDLNGDYNANETSWLLSPCFDFSLMNFGVISFDIWYETESTVDGMTLEYSTDGGTTWVTEFGLILNGHSHTNISSLTAAVGAGEGWSGSTGKWVTIQSYISPLGSPGVLYRFAFAANASSHNEGIAIDNIIIFDVDTNPATTIAGCQSSLIKNVSGFDFGYLLDPNGNMIASVSANGNNLGNVSAQVNFLNAVPQADNNVYYMPRYFNFSCDGSDCSPATFPNGAVGINLFFDSGDLASYNTENSSSFTINDLYLTHYFGANENCILNDNTNTTFSLVDKTNIFSTSYAGGLNFYLDFTTTSFSEFGAHGTNAVLAPSTALPIELIEFYGLPKGNSNELNWKTASEQNNQLFEIERSLNGQDSWTIIGTLGANGNSNVTQSYQFFDRHPLTFAYYRLRSIDFEGESELSNLIFIERNKKEPFETYPNPATDFLYLSFKTVENGSGAATIFDLNGKSVAIYDLNDSSQGLDISKLSSGVYFLEIMYEKEIWQARFLK